MPNQLNPLLLAIVIIAMLFFIFFRKSRRRHRSRLRHGHIFLGPGDFKMSFSIRSGQTGVATAVFTDAQGVVRPLAPGNVPVWAVTPPDALSLVPAADGMSCAVTGGENPEDFSLTATAEGDPTPGVDTIVATIAGTLVAPEDTQGTISVVLN